MVVGTVIPSSPLAANETLNVCPLLAYKYIFFCETYLQKTTSIGSEAIAGVKESLVSMWDISLKIYKPL